ncbi:MAG: Flp pilus assembly protein CpaB [Hyphomicrobiales bacterium]|nr:Flp pilus assembly protein CpaB [Hyphomicrobiales bacterium]
MTLTQTDRRTANERRLGGERRQSQGLNASSFGVGINGRPPRRFGVSRTKVMRFSILLIALGSGLGAARLASSTPVAVPLQIAAAPVIVVQDTDDVLVASANLPLGKVLTPQDLAWESWPKKLLSDLSIRKSNTPTAREDMVGSLVRSAFIQGEPMRAEKIVRANGSGLLAAMLPSGYRAVAINIDTQGANTAGGFILPNDRVDVIRTLSKADPTRGNIGDQRFESETLLSNIRVLAIGQNIQERNGERVVSGANATLEVAPRQAELLVLAQRGGPLSLALRSISDTKDEPAAPSPAAPQTAALTPSVITVGVTRKGARQEYSVLDVQR